jgi:two-component system sensor histidine kinase RegB
MEPLIRELVRSLSATQPGQMSLNHTKIYWLIRLRTIATITQTLVFIPGLRLGLIDRRHIGWYFLVVGTLTVFNGLSYWWIKHRQLEPAEWLVLLQLAVDLLGLTCLLNLSGGWANPFISLYFLHAGVGALLLQRGLNVFFFALVAYCLSSTFYVSGMMGTHVSKASLPGTTVLLAEVFIAFMIWMLTSWLAATFRALNRDVQTLREQNSRLDRLRAIGAIAAGFSHRLATPLNTVKIRLERLQRRSASLPLQDDIESAVHSLQRCEDILRTYFTERLEPEHLSLEDTEMVVLIERICKSWLLDHANVRLHLDTPRHRPLYCQISPVEFSRSLIDLLDNARDAQKESAAIDVAVRPLQRDVEIVIDDHGPGFSNTVLTRVGEPFLTDKEHGFGLGLFTAFALTHSLSGQFTIKNRYGGGGRVMIRLPIRPAEVVHDDSTNASFDRGR